MHTHSTPRTRLLLALVAAASLSMGAGVARAADGENHPVRAELRVGGAHTQAQPADDDDNLTPQERMARRWPQKVRAGDLVGLPLLDLDDRTLGFVRQVARTPQGNVVLVVPVGGWFGRGGRPVPVPLETVAILGRQIDLLDIPRADLPGLATWTPAAGTPIAADETLRIAISRR